MKGWKFRTAGYKAWWHILEVAPGGVLAEQGEHRVMFWLWAELSIPNVEWTRGAPDG